LPKGKTMSTRRLINNDYSFGNSQADIIIDLDECLQKCKTKLSQLKGEWFLDSRDGVAWGDVLAQRTNTQALTELVKKTLRGIDGIKSVNSLSVNLDDRQAFIIATLTTDFGRTDFNQSLNVLELLANDTTN
jgi:hypothetical protein